MVVRLASFKVLNGVSRRKKNRSILPIILLRKLSESCPPFCGIYLCFVYKHRHPCLEFNKNLFYSGSHRGCLFRRCVFIYRVFRNSCAILNIPYTLGAVTPITTFFATFFLKKNKSYFVFTFFLKIFALVKNKTPYKSIRLIDCSHFRSISTPKRSVSPVKK